MNFFTCFLFFAETTTPSSTIQPVETEIPSTAPTGPTATPGMLSQNLQIGKTYRVVLV